MGLKQTIEGEMKQAMKSRDTERLGVFRMLLAAFQNKEIEKRTKGGERELSEEEAALVLKMEVKKRRDSIAEFQKAGRMDLVEKESREIAVLAPYLPAEISDEEIEKLLAALAQGASAKDFGRVMGQAMKAVGGRASGERVSEAVRRMLTSSPKGLS